MNAILFISIALALLMATPPKAVTDSFEKKYPGIKAQWESEENNTIWEAEFKKDKQELEAIFRADGTFIGEEKEISIKDLPPAVLQQLKDVKVKEAELFTLADGSKRYEVEGKKAGKEIEQYYTEDGKPASNPEK